MLIPQISQTLFNSGMKFIDDIRRDNLATLAKKLGSNAALAQTLERTESQVSQWITGSLLPSGKRRGMRPETARWIEVKAKLPEGWLDQEHTEAPTNTTGPSLVVIEQERSAYVVSPHHGRPLVLSICSIAERVNDDGLRKAIGYLECLAGEYPLAKEKRA